MELKVASHQNCLKDWRTAGGAGELLSATKRLFCESEMRFVKWRSRRLRKLQNSVSELTGNKCLPTMRALNTVNRLLTF